MLTAISSIRLNHHKQLLKFLTHPQNRIKMSSQPPKPFSDAWHEHDPRWDAVDTYANGHLIPSYASADKTNPYTHALTNSLARGLPDISVSPAQGRFLALQARLVNAKSILEVGTLGAYSTLLLASAGPDVKVTSLEVNAHHAAVARENIAYAGLQDRVSVLEGAALDTLPKLHAEVEAGKREKIPFIFIDADKPNNLAYFNWAVKLAPKGGVIYVDNVVRKGQLADESKKDEPAVKGSRSLVEAVGKDERVDAVVLQTVGEKNYDGWLMAVVK
jgi:predicted O-methyltransferase YrrM